VAEKGNSSVPLSMTENQKMQVILQKKPLQKQTDAWLLKPTSSSLVDPIHFKENDYHKHPLCITTQYLSINNKFLKIPPC
jgi:hypothetical protein